MEADIRELIDYILQALDKAQTSQRVEALPYNPEWT
jgi:hypothetical protein